MFYQLSLSQIIVRLILTIICSGAIGYNRAQKNQPAGFRTHILVGLGACIIALMQINIGYHTLHHALEYHQYMRIFQIDSSRLVAQVVSGIGFLGAGAILVRNDSVHGLNTAASVWIVSGVGLNIGMGFYEIGICGTIAVLVVLTLFQHLFAFPSSKTLQLTYQQKDTTRTFIEHYFNNQQITIKDIDYNLDNNANNDQVCSSTYILEIPEQLSVIQIIDDLAANPNILSIKTINQKNIAH
ncbi:MgtC/SapB family protein [Bombilactobacillus bombi]|uniref:MgtC/SapB family protein n=1 Tax=Bombilactobacillus bombi TaxID=1303590 RepID=A0A3R7CNF1_9LACO|nr:MgtC/SapB family protein [Bombilactobacillus bombi]RHW50034.1 MgtC/SapB family protein [Bombilactobacillus bombi]